MKKERVQCAVVEQFCLDSDEKTANQRIPECFRCGNRVCKRCSTKRKYMHYGVKRLCFNCTGELDGHDDLRNFRMYIHAGYKVTMKWIRAMRIYRPNELYPRDTEQLHEQIARWKRDFEQRNAA